ncbi:MAG: hypothetical protein HZA89_14205, partial [Verrucomicrobia bacterium]|nr:hypothetical protein [Verrucomicrobiota bacterium]
MKFEIPNSPFPLPMTSETLHYESARFAQQLFHNDPRNLHQLEEQLGIKATARDGWIKLDGAA